MDSPLEFAFKLFYAHRDAIRETCKSESYTWRDSALVTVQFLRTVTAGDNYYDEVERHLKSIS